MLTAAQSRMARAALQWSVRDLAAKAGVAASTVNRFEVGLATPHRATLAILRQALEAAGVEFGEGGWLRLKERPPASP